MIQSLYRFKKILKVHDAVIDGVQTFRVETDSIWTQLMDIQILLSPLSRFKSKENPFLSITRKKRYDFSSLPDFCYCEPIKLICPPGPPGPVGKPGFDGSWFIIFDSFNKPRIL